MDEKRRNIFARLMDEAGLPPEEALQMVQGASEVGLSILTGLGGVVAGLPGSTGEVLAGRGTEEQQEKYEGLGATPEDTLLPTVGEMAEKWTYQPKTETGQRYAENVGKAGEFAEKWLRRGSGFIPQTLGKIIPGDTRLEAGVMNAIDQAIYTALNVMSPTRGAGTGLVLGAKGLQAGAKAASHLPGAKGLRNVDLVGKTAEIVEKAPIIKRYNQVNNAMSQLITRKQLAGLQPGVVQDSAKYVKGWYSQSNIKEVMKDVKGAKLGELMRGKADIRRPSLPKAQHLWEMSKTAMWRSPWGKLTNNQDAWLRAHYGITGNVYRELERLGRVMDSADAQRAIKGNSGATKFLDADGNRVLKEDAAGKKTINYEDWKSINEIRDDAANQYHAQIAYNRSVLEKFKPGDPRIARLASGEIDKYLTPKHKVTTINGLKNNPSIITDLIGKEIDNSVIRNHLLPVMASDMALKGSKIHISTKPFFTDSIFNDLRGVGPGKPATGLARNLIGRTVVYDSKKFTYTANKHLPYIPDVKALLETTNIRTKEGIINHFREMNKGIADKSKRHDIAFLKKNIKEDGDWISITQHTRTNDTLLASIPVRMVINKKNPQMGYYILYDQMKQGSGVPILETILDIGSDTNRIYLDIQSFGSKKKSWEVLSGEKVSGRVPRTAERQAQALSDPKATLKEITGEIRKQQEFDLTPTEEFLKRRRWGALPFGIEQASMFGSPVKRGIGAGLLAQDENI